MTDHFMINRDESAEKLFAAITHDFLMIAEHILVFNSSYSLLSKSS